MWFSSPVVDMLPYCVHLFCVSLLISLSIRALFCHSTFVKSDHAFTRAGLSHVSEFHSMYLSFLVLD